MRFGFSIGWPASERPLLILDGDLPYVTVIAAFGQVEAFARRLRVLPAGISGFIGFDVLILMGRMMEVDGCTGKSILEKVE